MKSTTIPKLILVCLLGAGMSIRADDASDLNKTVAAMDAAAKSPAAQAKALEHVSKQVGVPREKLEQQHNATSLGTGSLFIAHTLAKETGKSFEEIVAAHKRGKGWGLIARENGVKLGPLVSKARLAENETRKAAKEANKGGSYAGKSDESGSKTEPRPNHSDPFRGGPPGGSSPARRGPR